MTDDIDKVIAGLTKAQREALTFNHEVNGSVRVTPRHFYSQTLTSLEKRGLMNADYRLPALGLAVRQRLIEQGEG